MNRLINKVDMTLTLLIPSNIKMNKKLLYIVKTEMLQSTMLGNISQVRQKKKKIVSNSHLFMLLVRVLHSTKRAVI